MSFLDDYEPVENRLRAFWDEHPDGRIETELVSAEDGDYIVKALIYISSGLNTDYPKATGLAHDSTAQLPNNMKASALEVCETSAIGRALANLGYAPKGKRPSREEMSKSDWGRGTTADPTPQQLQTEGSAFGEGAGIAPADGSAGAGGREPGEGSGLTGAPLAPKDCKHESLSSFKPDGSAMPTGKQRCLLCGTVVDV